MNELRVYYSFFRTFWLLLVVSMMIGFWVGFYFYQQQRTSYVSEAVYEINDVQKSVEDKQKISEEVVGILREPQVLEKVLKSDVQNLYISRIGPFAVKVISAADTSQDAGENRVAVSRFISERAAFVQIGDIYTFQKKPHFFLFLLVGSMIGFLFGMSIALVKRYLQNF